MSIIFDPTGDTIKGFSAVNTPTYEVEYVNSGANEQTVRTSLYDLEFDGYNSDGQYTTGVINVLTNPANADIKFSELNLEIAKYSKITVNEDGTFELNYLWGNSFSGPHYAESKSAGAPNRKFNIDATSNITVSASNYGFKDSSLARKLEADMLLLINGKIPGDNTQEYVIDHNGDVLSPDVTINPNNIFSNKFDFTGVSIAQSQEPDDRYGIALISDRHGITAAHVADGNPLQVGELVAYKNRSGGYQIVTITGIAFLDRPEGTPSGGNDFVHGPDLAVICFNNPVLDCEIYTVPPANFADIYTRSIIVNKKQTPFNPTYTFPFIRKTMHDINDVWKSYIQLGGISNATVTSFRDSGITDPLLIDKDYYSIGGTALHNPAFEDWGGAATGGDSGSPWFLPVNDKLVLFSSTKGSAFASYVGGNIAVYLDDIETYMDTLAGAAPGTYKLNIADFSQFTRFDDE